jgi:hypothetical protein
MTMLAQAYQLKAAAISRSASGNILDQNTCTWLVRDDCRDLLMREIDPLLAQENRQPKMLLMGIPIRFTVRDEPDTPELQLVMEPLLSPRQAAIRGGHCGPGRTSPLRFGILRTMPLMRRWRSSLLGTNYLVTRLPPYATTSWSLAARTWAASRLLF